VTGDDGRAPVGQQLARFVAVGLCSAVVDVTVYLLALHLGAWVHLARGLSFVCGTATAYALNRRWTFRAGASARRAAFFSVVYGTTFLLIVGVNAGALALLPERSWTVVLAWALSQGFGTACNFVLLRTLVFRS
jgi:putative flippase GtrA